MPRMNLTPQQREALHDDCAAAIAAPYGGDKAVERAAYKVLEKCFGDTLKKDLLDKINAARGGAGRDGGHAAGEAAMVEAQEEAQHQSSDPQANGW